MKRALVSAVVVSGLASLGVAYPTELVAGDKSGRDGGVSVGSSGVSVSAGGVSVSAGRGGASVSTGGTSVSAGRDGASDSAGAHGATASADRGGASSVNSGGNSVSAGRDGASVSSGGASVSADRGGASVNSGGTSVSADRGGAASVGSEGSSVSAGRDGASVSGGGASVSADRGDRDLDSQAGRKAPVTSSGRPVGDRSYDSLGDWFADLRAMFTGKRKDADLATEKADESITHSSAPQRMEEASQSGQTQVNRVVQRQSSTEIATGGGSASAEARNVNETEQKN